MNFNSTRSNYIQLFYKSAVPNKGDKGTDLKGADLQPAAALLKKRPRYKHFLVSVAKVFSIALCRALSNDCCLQANNSFRPPEVF